MSCETPIMILFFNRPDNLKEVFNSVRNARPNKLFLVQDGPRVDHPDDLPKIEKCRAIVENIDWECEVFRNYANENMSCDHREFTGISWCFQYVDRLIILEDDCVPTKSFYPFCDTLLEKYKDDERIFSICGFNRLNKWKTNYDYLFSFDANGLGWATWKRVWEQVEKFQDLNYNTDYLNSMIARMDDKMRKCYLGLIPKINSARQYYKQTGKVISWELLHGLTHLLNHTLVITSSVNLINYIGVSKDATHSGSDARMIPHKTRKVLTQCAFDINHELNHPPFIIRDARFEKENKKIMATSVFTTIESIFLRLIFGDFKGLKNSLIKRFSNKNKKA